MNVASPELLRRSQSRLTTSSMLYRATPSFNSGKLPAASKANCACGGSCPACKAKSDGVKVSQPTDAAEIEADQVAEKIMRMPLGHAHQEKNRSNTAGTKKHPHANSIHLKYSAFDEESETKIQRKPLPSSEGVPSQTPDHVNNAISSGGNPLNPVSRSFFEPRLDHDLSSVRIHKDSAAIESARSIDAKAYTIGNNIVFGKGEYQPESQSGKHLLAHELAHVTQSANGSSQINRNTIYRTPVANGKRKIQGLPVEGVSLKTAPEYKKGNNFNAALVENGDVVVVKNNNVYNMINIKNGTWAWIDVPGKTSPQKDYPVMHGYIETKYLSAASNTELAPQQLPAPPQQQQAPSTEYVDFSLITDGQLESEINLMRSWLSEHSDEKIAEKMAVYEAEASERIEAQRKADEQASPSADAQPEEDITDLESALRTLKNGRYVSPLDQGASGASAEGPGDRANNALSGVDENFLVPATDEMAFDPVLRLEGSIKLLEARIAKQKLSVANWSTEAKLKKALESGIEQIGGQLGERLKELLSPESLAIIAAFAVAYVISQTTPIGWVADILVAAMLAATILMVGNEAIEIVKLLIEFVEKAEGAKNDNDIKAAGKAFAAAVTKAGVDIIVAILLHKAGKAANLKPPGPRSPGLIEVLKTTGEKVTTTLTDPAPSGWQVAGDGISAWDPGEFNMSMMEGPIEGNSGPKSSGGSGIGGGAPKAGGDSVTGLNPAKPTKGQGVSAGGGLPKKPIVDAIKGKQPPLETGTGDSAPLNDAATKSKVADAPTADSPAKDATAPKGMPAPKPATQPMTVEALKKMGIAAEAPQILDTADFSNVKLKPGQKALYVLRDTAGNILKPGRTSEGGVISRLARYKKAGAAKIEVYPLEGNVTEKMANTYETTLREKLEAEGNEMPWDNTGGRLGREGFGTPGEGVRKPPVTSEELIDALKRSKGNRKETGKLLAEILDWDSVHHRTVGMWAKAYGIDTTIYK